MREYILATFSGQECGRGGRSQRGCIPHNFSVFDVHAWITRHGSGLKKNSLRRHRDPTMSVLATVVVMMAVVPMAVVLMAVILELL